MTTSRSVLAGAAVVGAFVVGRFVAPEPPAPPPPLVHTVTAPSAPGRTVVREIVREVDREQPPPPEVHVAPDVIERHQEALSRARSIVSSAVGAGRWTRTDAQALVEVLPSLDREGADEVMTALIAPINAGHVKVETSGSLLDPT